MSGKPAVYTTRRKVLGYPVDVVDESEALHLIERSWGAERGMHVVTLNAEMVIQAQSDQELDRIIRHAHLIVPDGAGAVWALRLDGHKARRVPGIELAARALASAARAGIGVALIGAKPETLEILLQKLPELHPGINVVFSHHGYFSGEEEEARILKELAASKPGLVLIALGVPKQEFIIDRWLHELPGAVTIGVGGSFDVWAGIVKRAPVVYQRLNLEWFYRLMKEPWRAKRILSALPNFAIQVLVNRLAGCSDEESGSSCASKSGKWRREKKNSGSLNPDKSREQKKDV